MNMNINIDKSSIIPISQQIAQQISDRVISGFLKEGDQLPSVRELSKLLDVSPVTVVKVYKHLERDGLIVRVHGKGTYVKVNDFNNKNIHERNDIKNPFQWQMSIPDYLSRSQFAKVISLSYQDEGYNLATALINHALLPTDIILESGSNSLMNEMKKLAKYGLVQGDLELRKAFSEYFKTKGLNTSPKNIVVTSGSQQGLSIIAATFVGPGDIVVMEAPTYPGAIDLFRCRGATILTVPVDEEGMRTDILTVLCDKYSPKIIYTIPTYNNPTGYRMSNKRKLELLDIAQAHNSIIVEDDIWSDITFENKKIMPLKALDQSGHVILLKSFSKIIGPAYRTSALIADGCILSRLIAAKGNIDLGTPLLTQKMILDFFISGNILKYIKELNAKLLNRRNMVLGLLRKNAPPTVKWTVPEGGINIWITLPKHIHTDKLLLTSASSKKIYFLPGTIFYPNDPESNHLRISFSYLEEADLKKSVIELCKLIGDFIDTQTDVAYTPIV